MKRLGTLLVWPVVLACTLWACAALWIDGPASRPLAGALAGGFALTGLGAMIGLRPFVRGVIAFALLFAVVLGWWLAIEPSNERDWDPAVARLPRATIEGDLVTIENVRDFRYHTEQDYEERWETRSYDLSQLVGVDFFLSYWGSPWIAHTIVSWSFANAEPLTISIETRKERHEAYSAVLGFFRQFELYYVVADERDLIGVRTHHRGEDVYLYQLAMPPETARKVLLDYLREINEFNVQPRWYNAVSQNCTTTIRHHAQNVAAGNPFNWRILVNGKIDELGYRRGSINQELPFDELRRRSAISEKARSAPIGPDFSRRIREGLPTRPTPR